MHPTCPTFTYTLTGPRYPGEPGRILGAHLAARVLNPIMARFRPKLPSDRALPFADHTENPYSSRMSPHRARVGKGRLVVDEPTTLPDGSASSIAEAFRTTLDLFDTGLDLMRQNLRRSHPEAGDEHIELLLHEWVVDRPGAESGDCPGRRLDASARSA